MSRRQFIRLSTLAALVFSPIRIFAKPMNNQPVDDLVALRNDLVTLRNDLVTQRNDLTGLRALINQQLIDSPPNVPLGTILPYAGSLTTPNEIPENWKLCNGQELPFDGEFNKLFQKIGNTWGPPIDPAKFKLPDLRGVFLRGVNVNGQGLDPFLRGVNVNGEGSDPENRNVGSIQKAATQKPRSPFTVTGGTHNHKYTRHKGNFPIYDGVQNFAGSSVPCAKDNHDDDPTTVMGGGHTHDISGGDVETRPINAAVHWLIRVK